VLVEMTIQTVLCQGGDCTEHAAEGDIARGLKLRGGTPRQQSKGGTDPLDQPRAGHTQAVGCGDILLAALRLVGSVVVTIVSVTRRFG